MFAQNDSKTLVKEFLANISPFYDAFLFQKMSSALPGNLE